MTCEHTITESFEENDEYVQQCCQCGAELARYPLNYNEDEENMRGEEE